MRILIAGDFAPKDRTAVQIDKGDYSCLEEIKSIVRGVDYAIINLEAPVVIREAKPIAKTGPNLCCSERAMECLAQTGFKCVTLANNHFRDQGQIGVEDTLSACLKYEMDYVGGGKNLAEAQQVLYKDINGKTVAIVNFCENEWSIAGEVFGGSAPLNLVWNYHTIQEARKQADYVLVIVHGGIEGSQYPTPRMVDTYRFFIDAGADAVVNHHQHCYSGYEEYKGKNIFYGLGNFCFDWDGKRGDNWNEGYMVLLIFQDDRMKFEVIPYIQCDEKAAVILMNGVKRRTFDDNIKAINTVISNRKRLESQMDAIAKATGESRLNHFEPFKNRIVRKLQKWGALPSFIDESTLMITNNIIRCESHREILLRAFRNRLAKFQP